MQFEREVLLAALSDASAALAKTSTIPGLDHFWFDGKYVYAYDGGLGVRVPFKSELECGLPGKTLLDILKTSALKEVVIEVDGDVVVVKMGKSRVKLSSLDFDRIAWNFPEIDKKFTPIAALTLSEDVLAAYTQVGFLRFVGKATRVIHNGVVVVPQKAAVEFYTTDDKSIARVSVETKPEKELPRFVTPWAFLDRVLALAEPDNTLHVLEDCLVMEGTDGILVCSNVLELPAEPDIAATFDGTFEDRPTPVDIPAGLQSVLDRASILAGANIPKVTFTVEGKTLTVSGSFGLGSVTEKLELSGKLEDSKANFNAALIRRGLGQSNKWSIGDGIIIMDNDDAFAYVMGSLPAEKTKGKAAADEEAEAAPAKKGRKGQAKPEAEEEPEPEQEAAPARRKLRTPEPESDDPPPRRKPRRQADMDDEIPF